MLASYYQLFFVEHIRGLSYIPTLCVQAIAVVLLLNDFPKTWRGWLGKIAECAVCCVVLNLFGAIYLALFGNNEFLSTVAMAAYIFLYALLISRYPTVTRVVRGTMFMACVMVTIPISSPLSDAIKSVNEALYYSWGQYVTLVIISLLTAIVVAYLRHFSMEPENSIQLQYALLQVGISLVTIGIELAPAWIEIPRAFNVLNCAGLWGINLLSYYMFYSIARGTNENLALRTTQHRMELEQEKYEANRVNYDELCALRHELKNYAFYSKALLDAEKYSELSEFLSETLAGKSQILSSHDCGNYIVDVIMNHEINTARERNVCLTTDILVPHTLPYRNEDLCSLLFNLLDNAIEAAAASAAEAPKVTFSIRPKQEYLFIHQENSVSPEIPSDTRLRLKTTKKNRELHGYGTRIIRSIVEKYSGSIKYSMKDGMFVTDVMLELPKEDAQ